MDLSRTSASGYDIPLTEWKDLVDESVEVLNSKFKGFTGNKADVVNNILGVIQTKCKVHIEENGNVIYLSSRDSIMIDIRNAAYHKLNMYELLNAIESVFGLYYWNERK